MCAPLGEEDVNASAPAYVCDEFARICLHPDTPRDSGNRRIPSENLGQPCLEDPQDERTWQASCVYKCDEEKAPFQCADNCLNEDYPCRWVDGCMPPSNIQTIMLVCMRTTCTDHDTLITRYPKCLTGNGCQKSTGEAIAIGEAGGPVQFDTCQEAVNLGVSCSDDWPMETLPLNRLCPDSCKTDECGMRCRKTEVQTDGKGCHQRFLEGIKNCKELIRDGYDCHCTCTDEYRSFRIEGPFQPYKYDRDGVLWEGMLYTAEVNQFFDLQVLGRMLNQNTDESGSRIKIIDEGGSCGNDMPTEYVNLDCHQDGYDGTYAQCVDRAAMVTTWAQRWTDLKVTKCGTYDVCHCNANCYAPDIQWICASTARCFWVRTGKLVIPCDDPMGGIAVGPVFPPTGSQAVEEIVSVQETVVIIGELQGITEWSDMLRVTMQQVLSEAMELAPSRITVSSASRR
eukprot:CAMPEP_0204329130 /NCGR_PEP_ID=MMETSP0469-20131031/13921_1 /ASSEMBLY_ACC=CAM_ASM_000384 /TAXON_ID=2969 /ORGANISM="Oxyrrhis marina" /LENGTH=454 /DNA_ID=CAMNT_0051311673 /DNA_START=45 /DNA_END=1405 /DNA_ORIENTATION=+